MRTANRNPVQQRRPSDGERVVDSVASGQGLPEGVRLGGLHDPEEAAAEEVAARVVASGCAPDVGAVTQAVRSAGGRVSPRARVHEGGAAEGVNARLGAHGVTVGDDVYLGAAAKDPAQRVHLLAHELTHTGQHAGQHAEPHAEQEHAVPEPVARRYDGPLVPIEGPGISKADDNRMTENDASLARQAVPYVQQVAESAQVLQGIADKAAAGSKNPVMLAAAAYSIGSGIANLATGGLSAVIATPLDLVGGVAGAAAVGYEKQALSKRIGGKGQSKVAQAKSAAGAAAPVALMGAYNINKQDAATTLMSGAPSAAANIGGLVGETAAHQVAGLVPILGGIKKIYDGLSAIDAALDYAAANAILDQMGELQIELNFVNGSNRALVALSKTADSPAMKGFLRDIAREMAVLEQRIQAFAKKVEAVANRDQTSVMGSLKNYAKEAVGMERGPMASVKVESTRARSSANVRGQQTAPGPS